MESLYNLQGNYQQLLDLEDTLDPALFHDTLDSIKGAIEEKAVGYASVISQFKADVKMLGDEEKRLAERRRGIETKIDIMQKSLFEAMEETGTTKIKSPKFTVWVQNNPESVNVIDEKLIPEGFFIPQPMKLDKKQLREELKHGDIAGVELIQTRGLRIR